METVQNGQLGVSSVLNSKLTLEKGYTGYKCCFRAIWCGWI